MPRLARRSQLADDVGYHVMNRGHNRERVFRDDQDRLEFLARLDQAKSRHGFLLHHYCLMSNHFHLVIRPRWPRDLSRIVAGLLRSYVHYYHKRYRFVAHLWQGRFKGPAIQDGVYLLSCGRYVERNPLAAKMVQQPWEYRWSSCRHYALGLIDPRVDESPEIVELSPTAARRQKLWREFLMSEDPREPEVERGDWAVGDARFRLGLCHLHGRAAPRGRGRPTVKV
jgi:REP-associated tyrosine transposase